MVVSDILELPCLLAKEEAAGLAGDHQPTMVSERLKVDDSAMLLSSGRVAAAIVIDYRGLDYYYYYLVDSAFADLELGSDY